MHFKNINISLLETNHHSKLNQTVKVAETFKWKKGKRKDREQKSLANSTYKYTTSIIKAPFAVFGTIYTQMLAYTMQTSQPKKKKKWKEYKSTTIFFLIIE